MWNEEEARFQVDVYGYTMSFDENSQEIYSNEIELVDENIFNMSDLATFECVKIGNIFINNEK